MDPLQFIDVNDVGRFAIMASENENFGIYNCSGPTKVPLLWNDFLTTAKKHFKSRTELVWANEDFLKENQVNSFSDLPLWAPISEDEGFMQISNKKLIQTGFEFTPITSTLDDCMHWYRDHLDHNMAFGTTEYDIGLNKSRESDLIEKLKGLNQ
jgi:2'-hydroxyisoflavone reductase